MVRKGNVTIPELTGTAKRRIYVYLPDSYRREPERRYGVMYMFDGHNVFFDSDATYGKSWGMGKYMRRAAKQMIIVAVECNHVGNGRLQEYAPFDFRNGELGIIKGKGKLYMDWLVKQLKPEIDKTYRTLPDRGNTLICGSSMGGLMAMYAVTRYNHVFRRAACLSPSVWVDLKKVLAMIEGSAIAGDTCIYMDYGSQELANHEGNLEGLVAVANALVRNHADLTFRIVPGGSHCEASWEKQIPIFMECLGVEGEKA